MHGKPLCSLLLMLVVMGVSACGSNGGGSSPYATPVVSTRSGNMVGIVEKGVYAFLGIPYAAAPVGALRWHATEEASPWTDVFQADSFGPACPQPTEDNFLLAGPTDEDCLFLNVWTPDLGGTETRPVMFFIPGGGYTMGDASWSPYDGALLAQEGVVVVTANYRLGALGFLVHPDAYADQGVAGNYALYDLIVALNWVRDNIRAFGGDPNNVTIWGESAGSCSVALLQNAPLAQGLFHRAISESGTGASTWPVEGLSPSWQEAAAIGTGLQEALGCENLAQMMEKSAEEVVSATTRAQLPFGPVMDGIFLSDDPREACLGPANAPWLLGTNLDESTMFITVESLQDYQDLVQNIFGDSASQVLARYPAETGEEAAIQAARVYDAFAFHEPTRLAARGAAQSQPVYRYFFTRRPPTEEGALFGVFHGAEIEYIFGNLDSSQGYGEEDFRFSEQLRALWISFARTGRPTLDGIPQWPQFEPGEEAFFYLNGQDQFAVGADLLADDCDFFETLAPRVTPDYPQ